MENFHALGLPRPLLQALEKMKFDKPTPIQAQAIPPALEGRDVLGTAQTGTGKTAAFAIPMLARIVQMVAEAQRSRAPIQGLADTVSGWFVPGVIIAALLTFAAWSFFGPAPAMTFALVNAVAVLIIACPCALGLATPMAVAATQSAGRNSLMKSTESARGLAP